MCTVMVVDKNKITRNWLHQCINKSDIHPFKLILCKSEEDAETYISRNEADIVLTRIDKEDSDKVEFIKFLHNKLLFSIILGYGSYSDVNSLGELISSGVSHFLKDVFDQEKFILILKEAYEKYCTNKMKVKALTEAGSIASEALLNDWITFFVKNAKEKGEEDIQKHIEQVNEFIDKKTIYHAKTIVIQLMIILAAQAEKGIFKTDTIPFTPKDFCNVMKAESSESLKEIFSKYLKKQAANIYILNNASDYKSSIILSATNYIKQNYRKLISRDDVASEVSFNPSYFSKFFKEQTGESFVSYLRKIRLEEAMNMLANTKKSIRIVSENVGYLDSKYFARLFYKHTGYTPYEYRKTMQN